MSGTGEPSKGMFSGLVVSNKQVGPRFYRLVVKFEGTAATAFGTALPGQFVELDVSQLALPSESKIADNLRDVCSRSVLLRRPFSPANVLNERRYSVVEILYCTVGPATVRMTSFEKGDTADVIGPVGRGFSILSGKQTAVLVAGGMGSPPVQYLAGFLAERCPDMDVVVFAGARCESALPFWPGEFGGSPREVHLSTDDGSAGNKGLVTEHLEDWLTSCGLGAGDMVVYACGPEDMSGEVARITKERAIDCEISMERRMACGIGLCQGCVVECRVGSSAETVYKLCCEDGPVFDASEVVFVI